ncbi:uncharacterized protein LOC136080636 [Hydra vulgaris]|uniref:Uncharacterized protein LOC136080636 n=1 Tax=Hydra vulgaris TaxID=6087 RepID=A0ABM4BWQ7_HYDVU
MQFYNVFIILISVQLIWTQESFIVLNKTYLFETKFKNSFEDNCSMYSLIDKGPIYDFPIFLKVVKGLNGHESTVSFQSPIYGTFLRHKNFTIYMEYESSGTFTDDVSFILQINKYYNKFTIIQPYNFPSNFIISCGNRLYIVNESMTEDFKNRASFIISENYNSNCSVGWIQKGTYCYLFYQASETVEGKNWYNSYLSCQNYGGDLLSIADEVENAFIIEQLKKDESKHYWIGLNISSLSYFAWSDDAISQFTSWRQDEPNNAYNKNEACVEATFDGWNDETCENAFRYICKYGTGVSNDSCIYGGLQNGSHCYIFFNNDTKNWYNSLISCRRFGDLLSVTDQVENSFIVEQILLIKRTDLANNVTDIMHYWIGLNNYPMKRNFTWSDNTTLLFTNWSSNEPNNANNNNENCVEATYTGWNDNICQKVQSFICKAKAVNWSEWSEWLTSNESCIKTKTLICNSNQWLSSNGLNVMVSSDILFKEVNELVIEKEFLLVKNTLITTLSSLENAYSVSFMIKPKSYSAVWANVIHLTIDEDKNDFGRRIPGVWFAPDRLGALVIISAVNNDSNYYFYTEILPLNEWSTINISQNMCNGVYMFTCYINGKLIHNVENKSPKSFKNVKVYVADPWYNAQDGSIKEIRIKNGVNTTSPFSLSTVTSITLHENEIATLVPSLNLLSSVVFTPLYSPTKDFNSIIAEMSRMYFEFFTTTPVSFSTVTAVTSLEFNLSTLEPSPILINSSIFTPLFRSPILEEFSTRTPYLPATKTTATTPDYFPDSKPSLNLLNSVIFTASTTGYYSSSIFKEWTDWNEWSECSKSCGKGYKTSRTLNLTLNMAALIEPCMVTNCPVHGGWGEWIRSTCSKTCNGGIVKIYRTCDSPIPAYYGQNCLGISSYTEDCSDDIICPVNGNWSEWSQWSICTQPCGGGVTTRYRVCSNPTPKYGGMLCYGDNTRAEACPLKGCKTVNLNMLVSFVDEVFDESYLYLNLRPSLDLKEKIRSSIANLYNTFKTNATFSIVIHSIKNDEL